MFFRRPSRSELLAALVQAADACRAADTVINEQRTTIAEQHETLLAQHAMIEALSAALLGGGAAAGNPERPSCPHCRMSDMQAGLLGLERTAAGVKAKG